MEAAVHKFRVHLGWGRWLFGVVGPHGGMDVWTLCLGPLLFQFWPRAQKNYPPF